MATVTIEEARAEFSRVVDDVIRSHERVEVTKNGRRAAVLMSADEYDSLMESLDILGDAEAMTEIRQADTDTGRISTLEDVEAEMRASRRL